MTISRHGLLPTPDDIFEASAVAEKYKKSVERIYVREVRCVNFVESTGPYLVGVHGCVGETLK